MGSSIGGNKLDSLIFLTYLAVTLLIGVACTFIAKKLVIPNVLILLFAGIVLGTLTYNRSQLITFPSVFLTSISILALVMIMFDASSRLKFHTFEKLSPHAIKLSLYFLVLEMIFLTLILKFVLNIDSIFLALLFSALMSGTDPAATLTMIKSSSHKTLELLRIESLINTPFVVLIPFIIIDIMETVHIEFILSKFIDQILPFLQQFVAGIGAGILVGVIMLKFMKKEYSHVFSPLVMISSALLGYILAENLGGNGVLSVTVMGLLFGNVYIKQKIQLQDFSSIFSNSLEILVFILVGLIIKIPLNVTFFLISFILFVIFIIIRFYAIQLSLHGKDFTMKEKIFMALNAQKGIAVAIVIFTLATLNIPEVQIILNLTLAFMLYSIIISTIVIKFSKYFIKRDQEPKKQPIP